MNNEHYLRVIDALRSHSFMFRIIGDQEIELKIYKSAEMPYFYVFADDPHKRVFRDPIECYSAGVALLIRKMAFATIEMLDPDTDKICGPINAI